MDAQQTPRFVLEAEEYVVELTNCAAQGGDNLVLGKNAANDFVHAGTHTSRVHAYIELSRKDFYLVDTSTNGTFVQTEDERVAFVHRNKIRLWGTGWISLGQPLHYTKPIHFRQIQ